MPAQPEQLRRGRNLAARLCERRLDRLPFRVLGKRGVRRPGVPAARRPGAAAPSSAGSTRGFAACGPSFSKTRAASPCGSRAVRA